MKWIITCLQNKWIILQYFSAPENIYNVLKLADNSSMTKCLVNKRSVYLHANYSSVFLCGGQLVCDASFIMTQVMDYRRVLHVATCFLDWTRLIRTFLYSVIHQWQIGVKTVAARAILITICNLPLLFPCDWKYYVMKLLDYKLSM